MSCRAISFATLLALASGLTGCSWYLRSQSAIHIDCPGDDIEVANDRVEMPRRKWDARCRSTGRRYDCSALSNGSGAVISCKEKSRVGSDP
jgi:outer membrane lipopolysaccharide assembly protein LptE/RlpB